MIRNVVLIISTLAVLTGLYLGYTFLVGEPTVVEDDTPDTAALPPGLKPQTDPGLSVGPINVPPGGRFEFTRYDERTGRPTDRIRGQEWRPLEGSKNEIEVRKPELMMLMGSGMIATITADEGRLTVERVHNTQMRPKLGWLRGDTQIVLSRPPEPGRPADRTAEGEERIVIRMPALEFDLELGELKTDEELSVTSPDYEISGRGLHLVWNQADNRVELLRLETGRELVLYGAGIFDIQTAPAAAAMPPAEGGQATSAAVAAQPVAGGRPAPATPATPATPARGGRRRPPRVHGYELVLAGNVVATQQRGDVKLGGIEAEELRLIFDMGAGADLNVGTKRSSASQPASQPAAAPASRPAREEREKLVVHWTGPLTLGPAAQPPKPGKPRRRLTAIGTPLKLSRGDQSVECAKLEFRDDTQQIWLQAADGAQVQFGIGNGLTAAASSVYVDRARNVIKLLGDVAFESKKRGGGRPLAMYCSQWAELRLAGDAAPADAAQPADPIGVEAGRLRSAAFMGGVRVELGDQTLTSGQLDATFRSGQPGERLESLLESAIATGGAHLQGEDGQLDCGEMRLTFATADNGELYPTKLDAIGDAVIRQERSEVRGDRVIAELGAPPADPEQRTAFVLRDLSIRGRAELVDPARRIRARGDELAAQFTGVSELAHATVSAATGAPATVQAAPYSIRGRRIEIDPAGQAITVDGYSELRLRTNRSLQGEVRGRSATVKIVSTRKLDINGRENRVRFDGDVVVTSGAERTRADSLTLHLEDLPDASAAAPRPPNALDRLGWLGSAALAGKPPQEWAAVLLREKPRRAVGSVVGGRVRKEPVRLVAENAIVESEEYAAGDPQPVVHSSINAARFDIDLVRKLIRTEGQTTLFLTNRRLGQEVGGEREALGLPSALITKGPSQTVIQSDGGMVYAVGQSSGQRQDTVLFDGGVAFVHRAGREMVNLEQMLPQLAGDKAALDQLKARNAFMECRRLEVGFSIGADESRAGEGVLPRSGPKLAWLIAQDGVYLRDVEGPGTREVNATRIEFDRANSLVKVFGSDAADARVYYQNRETNRAETPAVGKRFIIDLANNTVRAGEFAGEARR